MFGNDSGMKEKILAKLLELFEGLGDEEHSEKPEGALMIEAEPGEEKKEMC